MRFAVVAIVIAACSGSEPARPTTPQRPAVLAVPGLRLPDTVTPLAYDLTLDIDPDQVLFRGEVAIEVRIERPTDHVWLHAEQLAIAKATWSSPSSPPARSTLEPVELIGDQMRAFRFGRVVAPGLVTLHFEFTGNMAGEQEGLFRQREGAWYVFSQGEAVFARRIVPCFDEPRWKTPWRVTLVVPKPQVALANMPDTDTKVVAGGKKQITFAPTPPMPSYLLAVAVGPFDLVDAGTVGRNHVPVRVAVRAGQGKRAHVVAARLPAIVNALETYLNDALPVAKLDIVAVPQFFGAMENPGLITFHEPIVLGDPRHDPFADYFTYIAAHELVHQWFGNLVTPAWWDHLWLSEAFASWLGDKVSRELDAYDDTPLRVALARHDAITADRELGAKTLLRRVTTTADADEGFDAIAYAKGQLVLGTFESFIGVDAFRDRLRAYLATWRDRSVTTGEALPAFASGDAAAALSQFVSTTGTPAVYLELRCSGKPEVIAHATSRVPVCISYGAGSTSQRSCALVGAATPLPIGPTCPTWVLGNPDAGYYHVAWRTNGPRGPTPPRADIPPLSRLTLGDDLAAAVERGELTAKDALAQLRDLADPRDPYYQLSALTLAAAIDEVVDDATRKAWTVWLAARFTDDLADKKPSPTRRSPSELEVGQRLLEILPPDAFGTAFTRRAADAIDKLIPAAYELPAKLVALAGVHGGDKLFERIAARARQVPDDGTRDSWLSALGELGVAQIPKAVELVIKSELLPDSTWLAVARYFERPAMRTAAWRAVKAELPALHGRMGPADRTALMKSLARLCDTTSRGEVATALADDKDLTTTLQAIDRCVDRRAKLGNVMAALAASP